MRRACLLLALAVAPAAGRPDPPALADARGGAWRPPADAKTTVLVFFGHDCPMSNAYVPELARLHASYAPKGVAFALVYADADLAPAAAKAHAADYKLPFPAVLDPTLALARRHGATVKPEAAVLSATGELLYRGRIDDINADFGKRRAAPTRRELADALDAVLAGRPVAVARTRAIGCDIDFPPP